MPDLMTAKPVQTGGGLGTFERYLSVWVALCMAAGIGLGILLPAAVAGLRGMEFGHGSQINAPIAVLIWLMITPMMMKVDFSSVKNVGRRPAGLLVTLFINWVVKPFSMALLAWAFFRIIFAHFITPAEADQYIAGSIILAAAPCTAMVFVWSHLTQGDAAYTLVQVSVNDLIMLVLFVPIVQFLVQCAAGFRTRLYRGSIGGRCALAGRAGRQAWAGMVGRCAAAEIRACHHSGVARYAGPHFCVSGRQHHGPLLSCIADRRPNHVTGVLECWPGLRPHEVAESRAFGSGAWRSHRCLEFL
jgi:hypothetical protein